MLVLTHDNTEISQIMNEEDNQEITNSWEILNKEPNYKTLAHDVICDFINFTTGPTGNNSLLVSDGFLFTVEYNESNLPGNRTINDFYKFTPASINSCESVLLHTKFVFPKEIYSYPVYTLTFPSVPVLLVSLSQNTHHSVVIATSSQNSSLE